MNPVGPFLFSKIHDNTVARAPAKLMQQVYVTAVNIVESNMLHSLTTMLHNATRCWMILNEV